MPKREFPRRTAQELIQISLESSLGKPEMPQVVNRAGRKPFVEKSTSHKWSKEDVALMDRLAKQLELNKTDVLRRAMRALAEQIENAA